MRETQLHSKRVVFRWNRKQSIYIFNSTKKASKDATLSMAKSLWDAPAGNHGIFINQNKYPVQDCNYVIGNSHFKGQISNFFFPIFIPNIFPSLAWLTYYEFTWLPTRIFLWSTIPQVAMPIKWTCWALSLNWAPRDMTVWPRTASPTWRMTPVFVPPVMIQAPVVSAAYKHKLIVL